ncbi:hypothetical protein QTJ16_002029 [Diplocarpon rosae]|uniref:Uncharacterized protein n=1 Tax=Diplocarpon rosae TaxID=946125 RepID=A0AAD9T3P8_9HELO|nr:hypothetical protein QTJ16_002029 [Diplocarpon rosae]
MEVDSVYLGSLVGEASSFQIEVALDFADCQNQAKGFDSLLHINLAAISVLDAAVVELYLVYSSIAHRRNKYREPVFLIRS